MKIKLFTHNDLDGVSCYIVAAAYYGAENVDVTYCHYDAINQKVTDFIKNPPGLYDHVYITDISVNEEVAELIETEYKQGCDLFRLIDHHKTAEWLNKYSWAYVMTERYVMTIEKDENEKFIEGKKIYKESGTSLFRDYLDNQDLTPVIDDTIDLLKYAEDVRKYDTWDWERLGEIYPKQLNDLLTIYGREKYIDKILNAMMQPGGEDYFITETDQILLDLRQEEIDRYIHGKEKSMKVVNYQGYIIGFIFSERFSSEMGNTICKNHPELDFVAMVNIGGGFVSLRTSKEDIDVSAFAKQFGGGGHVSASGMPLSANIKESVLALQFPDLLAQ